MIPWELLDAANIPGGGALKLKRRGTEFSIMLGDNELMNSRLSGSEQALATLACERIAANPAPRLLIGGLGMGFTLRAALEVLPAQAQVAVAELVPAVIAWARGPMADLHGASLSDARVTIQEKDVAEAIRAGGWDAILLDVDNGPDGLTRAANDELYSFAGLGAARNALRPGGVLAVWSAHEDEKFTKTLRGAAFGVEQVRVRAGKGRGARHVIWMATRKN